jgi:hypothetical protein
MGDEVDEDVDAALRAQVGILEAVVDVDADLLRLCCTSRRGGHERKRNKT